MPDAELDRRLRVFRDKRARLNYQLGKSMALLEAVGSIGRWVADLPSWLLPSHFQLWADMINAQLDEAERVKAQVDWLDTVEQLVDRGMAEFRLSEREQGDIDLLVDESMAGQVPSFELPTLGLVVTAGTVIVIGLIAIATGATTWALTSEERYQALKSELETGYSARLLDLVEAGELTPEEAKELQEEQTKKAEAAVKEAEAKGAWTFRLDVGSLEKPLKWAAGLAAIGGAFYLIRERWGKRNR